MPAHSKIYPWPSYYGHFNFFEERMKGHSKIREIKQLGSGLYELTLKSPETLRVFICECYSFGVAELVETIQKLGQLNAIVISSNWCSYTMEAKRQSREKKIGLFTVGDLMAALNKKVLWAYLNENEAEYFKKNGWK